MNPLDLVTLSESSLATFPVRPPDPWKPSAASWVYETFKWIAFTCCLSSLLREIHRGGGTEVKKMGPCLDSANFPCARGNRTRSRTAALHPLLPGLLAVASSFLTACAALRG